MTRIQQVLFEVETDYAGNPFYVSGHALWNAISRRVDAVTRRALCVSHGVFVPGEYGDAPSWHSWSGSLGKVGGSLPPVERYDDLFVFRDAAQRWLKSSRPRDAHNVHPLVTHGGRVAFGSKLWFGRPPEVRTSKRSVRWFVQCYLHGESGGRDVVPVSREVLDGVRVGGARNYGFGELSLVDSQVVDLDELDYRRVSRSGSGGFVLELVSPFVLASEFPGADGQSVPWWWGVERDGLREREERLVQGEDVFSLRTVDHGQVVWYAGDDPVGTARNGVVRVGTHSRFGFGEFRVRPAGEDRVPDRVGVTGGGEA
ncbi:hypothetical protein [Halovivax gelatinilyticus]|uniref:hypothetical protein n=1 Tax=Halovivax gelatinilyticus TaxID=2961597 RepID=UPI0020CA37A2|nr:hypothetical protein [Halovivax gelatinilyticus]